MILAHGADRHPAQTATDWVTYADHVVEVTPVSEREIAPSQDEADRGEGLILRKVTLRVDKVLWSSDTAAKAPPHRSSGSHTAGSSPTEAWTTAPRWLGKANHVSKPVTTT
ncbi:hypothetical protein [Streptomyces sp. enrichment culture]|uniref:hypothetical protein n=1 Tax=Streptomyces sp. enrichment culture TaxID=1795815 RepID=UPI003F55B00F